MKCPYCACTTSKVVDKRDNNEDHSTRRRRQCLRCGRRYTTYERIEKIDISILKKDGSLERFDVEKLRKGILKSIDKDKISQNELDDFCEGIERKVMVSTQPVSTTEIGALVLEWLKGLDPLAYMRFASVYKNFETVSDLKKEIENLI
jgi:transcriptional repressor NrdR